MHSISRKWQGSTWYRGEAQRGSNKEPVFPHRLHMQLCLLCLSRISFLNANLPFLVLLGFPHFSDSPTARFRTPWSWNWCHWTWLVQHILLHWESSCQPMVCYCQYCYRICCDHICPNPLHILVQYLQSKELPHILRWPLHLQWPRVQYFGHYWLELSYWLWGVWEWGQSLS